MFKFRTYPNKARIETKLRSYENNNEKLEVFNFVYVRTNNYE
jgi:hypothetical protein